MAKKRKPEEGMPASPLAAKLASQLSEPRPAVMPAATLPRETPPPPANTTPAAAPEKPRPKAKAPKKISRTTKGKEARVMLDADEWAIKGEVIAALRAATGEQVEFSHLMRSLLSLASGAIPAIEGNTAHATLPSRPANNDLMGLAEFEDELGRFLLLAFRDKKAMDGD